MNPRERFLFGAAGAAAPSLLNLLLIDATNVLAALTPIVAIVYAVRILALALVGGVVSWAQKELPDGWRCIQVGIAAPALFMAGLNGVQVAKQADWRTGIAWAQTVTLTCEKAGVRYFSRPTETKAEQIDRGLYGKSSTRTWFVILQYHQQIEPARDQAKLIMQKKLFPTVELYCAPDRRQPSIAFAVVVGEHLALKDAEAVLKRALEVGFANASLFNVAAP